MRSKLFFIPVLALFTFVVQAEHVSVEKALQAATQYSKQLDNVSLHSDSDSRLTLAYTEKPEGVTLRSSGTVEDVCYYVFNIGGNGGFVIVAGDDRAYPVLGYSAKNAFDMKTAPPVLLQWLQNYWNEIASALKDNPNIPVNPEWQALEKGVSGQETLPCGKHRGLWASPNGIRGIRTTCNAPCMADSGLLRDAWRPQWRLS